MITPAHCLSSVDSAAVEARLATALESEDWPSAAGLAVELYGPEIRSFLGVLLGDRHTASDVFAQSCTDLLAGLSSFERRSTLRAWFYGVARNAALRALNDGFRRRRATGSVSPELVSPLRSATPRYQRTDWKQRLGALRDRLTPDERALLVLRVDRAMEWAEIAEVLGEPARDPTKSTAVLRKRFERLTAKLKELAVSEGWLDE